MKIDIETVNEEILECESIKNDLLRSYSQALTLVDHPGIENHQKQELEKIMREISVKLVEIGICKQDLMRYKEALGG